MKKLFALFAFALLSNYNFSQAPDWQWVKSAGGNNSNDLGNSVVTDASGNIFVCGTFESPNLLICNTNLTNLGGRRMYLAKYDANGNGLWAKSAGASSINSPDFNSMAIDASGNVYIIGFYSSPTINFDSINLINEGSTDIYLVKYDPNGNVLWAKSAGGKNDETGYSVAIDVLGNIYITGGFSSPTLIFGATTLINSDTSGKTDDKFLAKYDPNGNVLWAKSAQSINSKIRSNGSSYITTDRSGNVYITGDYVSSTIGFENFTLSNVDTTGTTSDLYIVKYDPNGNVLWANSMGGNRNDDGLFITTDVSQNLYVTGRFASQNIVFGNTTLINADNGHTDMFLVKYDLNGIVIWAKSAGGVDLDAGVSVVTDAFENSYVTGWYKSSTIVFGSTVLINSGSFDMFVTKYDPNGNVLWAKSAGNIDIEHGNSIAIDITGSLYVTGGFDSPTLNFGSIKINNADHFNGTRDMYLAKIGTLVGTSEIYRRQAINIYPNPFNSQTTINLKEVQNNSVIKILDVYGKEIKKIFFDGKQVIIHKGEMTNGIYFIQILDEKNIIFTEKIIIQ